MIKSSRAQFTSHKGVQSMMAKSHMVIGAAAWIIFSKLTQTPVSVLLAVVATGASLLPDMDHPKSMFGQLIKPVSIVISGIFGHRGITHSFLAIFLIGFLMWKYGGVGQGLIRAVSIGYLSHLFADFLTPHGVPLMYPLKTKFKFLLTVKTDGIGESLIAWCAGLFIIYAICSPAVFKFSI